jgi:hypothetical protein
VETRLQKQIPEIGSLEISLSKAQSKCTAMQDFVLDSTRNSLLENDFKTKTRRHHHLTNV